VIAAPAFSSESLKAAKPLLQKHGVVTIALDSALVVDY
jgi:hypothetical protein